MARELEVDGEDRDATPSASVLVVRDGDAGVEVLMLERHLDSDFVGGALVFPGGKVDPADAALPAHLGQDVDDVDADVAALGVDDAAQARAFRAAAVRETFEEAGILLAHHRDGRPVTADDLADEAARAARAGLVDRGPVDAFHAWLDAAGLVLDLGALAPWSWWVTPVGVHRRFDTRFFVATVPPEQRDGAAIDAVEVTSARWTTPRDAVAAHHAGAATVIFPTRCNLDDLAVHGRADDAVAAARRRPLTRILPTVTVEDGRPLVHHPDGRAPEAP